MFFRPSSQKYDLETTDAAITPALKNPQPKPALHAVLVTLLVSYKHTINRRSSFSSKMHGLLQVKRWLGSCRVELMNQACWKKRVEPG